MLQSVLRLWRVLDKMPGTNEQAVGKMEYLKLLMLIYQHLYPENEADDAKLVGTARRR